MIKDVRHFCVNVKDMSRALRFYRDFLGFKVSKVVRLEGEVIGKLLKRPGISVTYTKLSLHVYAEPTLELYKIEGQQPDFPNQYLHHISFTVDDVDKEYKRLSKLGVRFLSKPMLDETGKTKIVFCSDYDDNLVELMQDIKQEV